MDFGAKPSGTKPGETQEGILAEELEKLQNHRSRMKEENAAYLRKHPELREILDEFMTAALVSKPADVLKFAAVFFTKLRDPKAISGPMPLVITGCSGSGKSTIAAKLLELYPQIFAVPIKHTSRAPRQGEENGVQYYFVQKSDIEGGIARREFIDYSTVANSMYGIKMSTIDDIRKKGKICLLDVEYKETQLIKDSMLVVKYLFIAPPTMENLDMRLKQLDKETFVKITQRMTQAKQEWEAVQKDDIIDKIVINDNIDQCMNRLIYQLDGFYPDINFHEHDMEESA